MCVGRYAKRPYCIENLGINVHSAEELCYAFAQNAYMLDASLTREELIKWIEKELGLSELSTILRKKVNGACTLSDYVITILEYVGLFDREILNLVRDMMVNGAGLSFLARKKKQIDRLFTKKRYMAAAKSYELLGAECVGKEANREFTARILCDAGCAYGRLFMYEKAAEKFEEAYKTVNDPVYLQKYLACKRFLLDDRSYLDYVATLTDRDHVAEGLEKVLFELENDFERSPEAAIIKRRYDMRHGKNRGGYEESNTVITGELKNDYRLGTSHKGV